MINPSGEATQEAENGEEERSSDRRMFVMECALFEWASRRGAEIYGHACDTAEDFTVTLGHK